MHQRITLFTRLFPLWAISLSAIAYFIPAPFIELKASIMPLLTIIMFSMGLTFSLDDFKRALSMPKLIISGLLLQYTIMPLAAIFSIWHNLSGSALAYLWSKKY